MKNSKTGSSNGLKCYQQQSPELPGAYQAAALQPVGVVTGLTPQTAQCDDSRHQIGRLGRQQAIALDPASLRRVKAILAYDGDRDAAWESAIHQATSRLF